MVIARGKRLVPFRTQKLRLFAPMVLHFCGCGRVGHRGFFYSRGEDPIGLPLFLCTQKLLERKIATSSKEAEEHDAGV